MFLNALRNCNSQIEGLKCCGEQTPCNCEECLRKDYYCRNDTYNCLKKMDTYAIKYGPSYISEIYHYLAQSNILNNFKNSQLNVISLGCGFAPDFYAIQKHCIDNQLNIQLNYNGLDISAVWNTARPPTGIGCQFIQADLTQPFNLQDANIVFICKSFSTMFKHGIHEQFLLNLTSAINQSMSVGSFLLFVDVNHGGMGRDIFDSMLSQILTSTTSYYFSGAGYTKAYWTEINATNVIYPMNQGFSVSSIPNTNDTVIFEYRK